MTTAVPPAAPLPIRALRISLVLGAIVDLTGGIPLLLYPDATTRWLGVPADSAMHFWSSYASVFLFVLPMVYLITAINPVRNLANVGAAIGGRALGAFAYAYWWAHLEHPTSMLGLALLNVAFAYYYYHVLRATGRAQLRAALRVSNYR